MRILDIIHLANNTGQSPNKDTPIGSCVMVRDDLFAVIYQGVRNPRYGIFYRKAVKITNVHFQSANCTVFSVCLNNRSIETLADVWLKII